MLDSLSLLPPPSSLLDLTQIGVRTLASLMNSLVAMFLAVWHLEGDVCLCPRGVWKEEEGLR